METKPFFSVIVPVYNCERFIADAIKSVIDQTFPHWELILVDDGSSDKSKEVILNYLSDPRIKYLYQSNKGQGAARNTGIINSSAPFICFIDADDLWTTNKLELQHNYIQNHPDTDFVYTLGYYLYSPENRVEEYSWVAKEFKYDEFLNLLLLENSVNTDTVAIRRSVLNLVGFFDEATELRGSEDYDLWLRVAEKKYKVAGIPERTAYYRIWGNGVHHNTVQQFFGKTAALKKVLPFLSSKQKLKAKRTVRYFTRMLLNENNVKNDINLISVSLARCAEFDRFGLVSIVQRALIKTKSTKAFNWISNKLLYRIGYRIENIYYMLNK